MNPVRRMSLAVSLAMSIGCGASSQPPASTRIAVGSSSHTAGSSLNAVRPQRPSIDCNAIVENASSRRMLVNAVGHYTHLSDVTCPGYYTVVAFSSPGCAPCEQLWEESIQWLTAYPNVLFVVIDLGLEGGPHLQLPLDLEFRGQVVPIGVLIGPFGQLMARGRDASEIRAIFGKLEKRRHRDAIFELSGRSSVTPPLPIGGAVLPSSNPSVAPPAEPTITTPEGTTEPGNTLPLPAQKREENP